MNCRPALTRLCAILLSIATLLHVAAPPVRAASGPDPLGTIVSTGHTLIDGSEAPTGTTIFTGDRVRSDDPALISLNNGGRIEITRATASFDRKNDVLVLQADEGLFRFRFEDESNIEIKAADYRFTAEGNSGATGELGVNRRGQVAMNLMEGSFQVLNTVSGIRTEVSAAAPFAVMDQTGRGRVVNNGKTVTDDFLSTETDLLKGQCIVIDDEAYAISGNSGNLITVTGSWELKSGEYTYQVVACTEEALVRAGASREAAKKAVVASVFGVPPVAAASHTARNVAIVVGIGAGVGVPLAIKAMKQDEKSPSSR